MNYLLLIALILIIILVDIRDVMGSRQRFKVIAIYFTLLLSWSLISFLLAMDRAPVSPALIIKGIIEGIKGWIK